MTSEKTKTTKEALRPQDINKMKQINLSTVILSNVITAFTVGVAMFIWGYFTSVNIHQDARARYIEDVKVVKNTAPSKE